MKFKIGEIVRFKDDACKRLPSGYTDRDMGRDYTHGDVTLGTDYFKKFAMITKILEDNRYGVTWKDGNRKQMHLSFPAEVLMSVSINWQERIKAKAEL
jgi:hypothetical protein